MTTQPPALPVTLTVGSHTAEVGRFAGNADTWRENLAVLLRHIADEFARPPIRKLTYCMPTALGTCESCGHQLRFNLAVDYVEHVEPQPGCDRPFPAIPTNDEGKGVPQ